MATYIVLSSWTQKGIENVKDSPARLDKFKELLQANGCRLKDFYLTIGSHDFAAIVEAPDEKTFATVALRLASQGNVRTQSLQAFPEEEYRAIIGQF